MDQSLAVCTIMRYIFRAVCDIVPISSHKRRIHRDYVDLFQ